MGKAKVEILDSTLKHRGFFSVGCYRLRYRRYDGRWSPEHTREVFERGNAVAVLPYDPVNERVVLIEQFRAGAYIAGVENPWLTEVVAGILDPGAAAEHVVRKEAREEAGLSIGRLHPCARYLTSPGGSSEFLDLFIGQTDASHAGGIHGLDIELEDIKVLVYDTDEALALLGTPAASNATLIIALQYLALHKERIRQEFLEADQ